MLKYIIKRVGAAIFTLFVTITVTFFLMNAVPGNPFMSEKKVSDEVQAQLNKKYGLDVPLHVQYVNYLKNLAKGDLGISFTCYKDTPVTELIAEKFPVSAKLGLYAVILAILIGVPLGCIAAFYNGKLPDNIIRVTSTLGIAVPSFVVASLLLSILACIFKVFPVLFSIDNTASSILPIITLSLYPACYITRLMRSSMLDAIGQDYIRTAKAKGMSTFSIIFKHALRNSIIPIITYLGPMIAGVLTGAFIVENIFTIPGMGLTFVNSISSRDYNIIMGTTVFLAALIILMNLVCDILYKIVDPRITLDE